jgi:sterol desaturase/sphingolipid hydroxylase (fatty acid hydroxylase superfamily)
MDEQDRHTIPMAWWNGPLLIAATQIPFLAFSWISGRWGLLCGTFLACAVYYAAYEYLHWCMHLPAERSVERSGVFFRLNGHHLLHHRYMNRNFNVVLPVADFFLGTLLLRSKVTFAQARGAAVPDVQPSSTEWSAAVVGFAQRSKVPNGKNGDLLSPTLSGEEREKIL